MSLVGLLTRPRLTKKNPNSRAWNPVEIVLVNPHLDGVPLETRRELQEGAEAMEKLCQLMVDEAVSDLDRDLDMQ